MTWRFRRRELAFVIVVIVLALVALLILNATGAFSGPAPERFGGNGKHLSTQTTRDD